MDLIRCICNETRFEILCALQNRETSVGSLVNMTGKNQPLVSHHLKTLKKCGIVSARNQGNMVIYSITPQMSRLIADIIDASKKIPGLCDENCC